MLAQLIAAEYQPVVSDVAGLSEGPESLRVPKYLSLILPQFTGTNCEEYPQHFFI